MRKKNWLALGLATLIAAAPVSSAFAEQWKPLAITDERIMNVYGAGGEGGQWIQGVEADPNTGDFMIFTTDVGGMYRSLDGGASWAQSSIGFNPRGANDVAIDPNNSNRVLVVGSNSVPDERNGIYLSTDKGATWQSAYIAKIEGYRDYREQLAFDKSSYDPVIGGSKIAYWSRIAVDTNDWIPPEVKPALYKSIDGGATWQEIPNSSAYGGSIVKVHPTQGFVYVANSTGFYKSIDGGASFTQKVAGDVKSLDVIYTQSNRVYINKADGVYVSNDSGESFQKVNSSSFPSINPMLLKVSPVNPNRMILTDNALDATGNYADTKSYYSTDGGATWTASIRDNLYSYIPFNARQNVYAWDPNEEQTVWSSGGDYFMKSINSGAQFRVHNKGNNGIMQGGSFNFNFKYPDLLYMNSQDYNGAVTQDGGLTWKYVNPSRFDWGGWGYGAYAVNPKLLLVATRGWNWKKQIAVSRDAGVSWTNIDLGRDANGDEIGLNGLESSYADPTDDRVLFVHEYRSEDQGYTWTKMTNSKGVLNHHPISKDLYGGNNGKVVRSQDKGKTWQTLVDVGYVADIGVDHVNNLLYIATGGGIYKYNLSTSELTSLNSNIPKDQAGTNRLKTVAVDPVDTNVIYAGGSANLYSTDASVVRSTDGGVTWQVLTRNTRNSVILAGPDGGREASWIRVHPVTRYAYVAGQCYGMWVIGPPGDTTSASTAPSVTIVPGNGELKVDWFGNGRVTQAMVDDVVAHYGSTNVDDVYAYDIDGSRAIDSMDRDMLDARRVEDAAKALDSFEVHRSTSVNGTYSKIAGPITASEYKDGTAVNGTTYYYKVKNVTTGIWSDPVKGVAANQGPAAVYATEFTDKVELTWTARSATSYKVLRSTTSGSGYTQIASGITTPSYTDTTAAAGTTYYYVVKAVNAKGDSANSLERSAKRAIPGTQPLPPAPGDIRQGDPYSNNFDSGLGNNWSVKNAGVNSQKLNSSWDAEAMAVYHGSTYSGNYRYKVDVTVNGSGVFNRGGILFNYQDEDNYYYLDIGSYTGTNTINLKKKIEGGSSTIASYSNYNMNTTTALEVFYEGDGYITVTAVQGSTKTTLFNRVRDRMLKGGKIGIRTEYSYTLYDNLQVIPMLSATPNKAGNPGFETGSTAPWDTPWGAGAITSSGAKIGQYAVKSSGSGGIEQTVSGLKANTSYTVRAFARAEAGTSYIGVKNFGGTEINTSTTEKDYQRLTVTFTTGAANTSAKIYFWKSDAGTGYADEFEITESSVVLPSDLSVPTQPSNVNTVPGAAQIDLTWNASTDNTGVTGYRIYRDGVQVGVVSGTSYSDTSVTAGSTYKYMVRAVDAAGNLSAASTEKTVTVGTAVNLVGNPGFETGAASPWEAPWGGGSLVSAGAHAGSYAVTSAGAGGIEQWVSGLQASTTYTLKAHVKTDAGSASIGVKNITDTKSVSTTNAAYTELTLTFTTGSSETSAKIYFYKPNAGNGFGDSFTLTKN
ncbi:hypothetical protein ACFO9Q_01720 [Paenibacillus sp. GCM10023252]|uniref:VPS10 domain-containing protein n=1 Tax=Paenibacillus sp. GCM10023252 TaxID=3252649 RepID=UPI0036125FC9